MPSFTVRFYRRDFTPLPAAGLEVDVERYAWAAIGGPESAVLQARGPAPALAQLAGGLRGPVEIYDPHGAAVWWGYVHEVALPGLTVSLDPMANRCAALYRRLLPEAPFTAPGTHASITAWAEDAGSVAEYGEKALRLALPSPATRAAAEAARDAYLALSRYPVASLGSLDGDPEPGDDGGPALIRCRGWWDTLAWQYYACPAGLEPGGDLPDGAAAIDLGQGFASEQVCFQHAAGRIADVGGACAAFAAGDRVEVSGSAANDGRYEVTAVSQAAPRAYTAATLSFSAAQRRILDASGGLGFLESRDCIRISGSAANDGYQVVKSAASDGTYVEVWGALADGAAGPAVTLRRGNWLEVSGDLVDELPSGAVRLLGEAGRVAQGVRLPDGQEPWACHAIVLRAGRVGLPGDSLRVALCADSGGEPGPELAAGQVAGSELGSVPGPAQVALDVAVPLAPGVPFWILVSRTGPAAPSSYYRLAVDDVVPYPRGARLLHSGAALATWQPAVPEATLCFQAAGLASTAAQLRQAFAAAQFVAGAVVEETGDALGCPYRDGSRQLSDEVLDLLRAGSGQRLLALVEPDRSVRVYPEPAAADAWHLLKSDRSVRVYPEPAAADAWRLLEPGDLRGPHGERLPVGGPVVGVWLEVTGASWPVEGGAVGAASPIFVERCEVDARTLRRRLVARRPTAPGV